MITSLLTLALLASPTDAACSPRPPLPEPNRTLQLQPGHHQQVHCFYGAPGTATVFLFDAPVRIAPREGDAERFRVLLGDERKLVLMPEELKEGEGPLEVQVEYTDGAVPRKLTLRMVVDTLLAERQVDVHREALPPQALERKLADTTERLVSAEKALTDFLASHGPVQSLAGALRAKLIDERGVTVRRLPAYTPRRMAPVVATLGVALRSYTRLLLLLELAPGAKLQRPFHAAEVLLMNAAGKRQMVVHKNQERLVEAGSSAVAFTLEFDATNIEGADTWYLRLRGEGEASFFTVAEVTLPDLPQAP